MNNKLKSKKLIKITIILAVLLVPIGLVASFGGYDLGDYPSTHTGNCHGGASAYPGITGSGNIELTMTEDSVKTGAEFTVTAKLNGFTEADDESISIGYISDEEDNNKFTFSPTIKPISLTNGYSADEDFTVTAPLESGTYTIKIMALHEESDGDGGDLITLTKTLDIIVKPNPPPTSYISSANYLVNIANRSYNGYRWGESYGSTDFYAGWKKGAAGIGDFLIEAYNKSGNSLYLNYSIGAARWLWNIRHTNGTDSYWSDIYGPNNLPISQFNYTDISAEIGKFFIKLYENSNYNVTYLDWAEEIAQYLNHEDQITDPNEMAWKSNDSLSYLSNSTTQVIGNFFIELQRATGNFTYKWWALNVSRYLINAADTSGIGASWKKDSQVGSLERTGKWAGAAGIGDFLLNIYKNYDNITAYEYANKTFDWLYAVGRVDQGGYIWDDEIGDGEDPTGFGFGVAGISTFLWRLTNITGNNTHRAVARGSLQYLISNQSTEEGKVWWNASSINSPYQVSGKGNGMAGIGEAFLYALNYTTNSTYNGIVEGIYTWYYKTELRNDLNDSLSTVWNTTNLGGPDQLYSGVSDGAAGVGFFLLRRAEYLNDTFAPLPGYLKTAVVSGASVTLNVTNALDYESGLAGAAFYIVGPDGGQGFTNETYYTISLSTAGLYTAYAIIFDAVGNPSQRTNSTTFTITSTSTSLPPEDDDGGSRDLWEDPGMLRISIGFIASVGVLVVVISLIRKFNLESKRSQGRSK